MSAEDLETARTLINLELHACSQRAELGDREAAPRADGLRSAAMIVDMLIARYGETAPVTSTSDQGDSDAEQ